jgi:hypothetical protein
MLAAAEKVCQQEAGEVPALDLYLFPKEDYLLVVTRRLWDIWDKGAASNYG